jgi:hypothetical protein
MLSAWIRFPSLRPHSFSPPLPYLKVYQFLTRSTRENLHVVDQSFLFLLTPMARLTTARERRSAELKILLRSLSTVIFLPLWFFSLQVKCWCHQWSGGGWVAGRSCWWSVCHNVGFLLFSSSSLLSFSQ